MAVAIYSNEEQSQYTQVRYLLSSEVVTPPPPFLVLIQPSVYSCNNMM